MEQENKPANWKDLPINWGVLIGVISTLVFTIYAMFLIDSLGIWGVSIIGIVSFILTMVFLGIMAAQQRKSQGGYITTKEAFRSIFLSILIIVAISNTYGLIYPALIDKSYNEKMKETTLSFTAKFGADDKQLDKAAAKFDEEEKTRYKPTKILFGYAGTIVFYSLFGLIVAAIVKRNKPEHLQA